MKSDNIEYIKSLENDILKFKQRILELEDKISSQQIIIDALVAQQKLSIKRNICNSSESLPIEFEQKKFKENSTEDEIFKNLPIIGENFHESESNTQENSPLNIQNLIPIEILESKETEACIDSEKILFINQVKDIFTSKLRKQEFKANFTFKKFIEYAEMSYEFNLNNKKISKAKNPLKLYIESNLDKILKFIIDNITTLNMNQVCSTLFLINSEMDYKNKLVFIHDIALELTNCSKLLYFVSAILNNQELLKDTLSMTIYRILYHQYIIDTNIYNDPDIGEYLEIIRNNLSLCESSCSIWDHAISLIESNSLFSINKGNQNIKNVKPEIIENGFSLRLICHYLDWDFTYNTIIVTQIAPSIKDSSSELIYYLGILAMDAYRYFKDDPSVIKIFEELRKYMSDVSDLSVASYLILKQVFPNDCDKWLNAKRDQLKTIGFSNEFLQSFLLL